MKTGIRPWLNSVLRRGRRRYGVTQKAVIVIFLLTVAYQIYGTITMPVRYLFINENINQQCIIPDLDPFDQSIMKYVWSPDPIICDPAPDLVFEDMDGLLQLNKSAFQFYGSTDYSCFYAPLRRLPDDDHVEFGDDVPITFPMLIPHDFFRVRCHVKNAGKKVFEKLLESVYVDNNKATIANEQGNKYSVFMFGLDSTSRLSAIRKLPKTYDYITNVLNGYVFRGYMKVGDNTFPNLVPVLTGKRPWTDDLSPPHGKKYDTNVFPFIWSNFSRENYVTLFAEDYPIIATFNTEANGFQVPPTDHYMRPWMLGLRKIEFFTELLRLSFLKWEYSNVMLKKVSSLCYGNTPIHAYQVDYYKRFASRYQGKLRFAFSWLTQICHEYINLLELGDNDFLGLFRFLQDNGHLDNAFLIFFSDHGSRLDDIRNTFIGRIEERMPLLTIVPPKNFKAKFPDLIKNMQDNTEKLTSNFDLFETLNDILLERFDHIVDKHDHNNARGVSLLKPISDTRSCSEASIPEHFCACYASTKISPEQPLVHKAALFAVDHLNDLLADYKDICDDLKLLQVTDAYEIALGLNARGHEETRFTLYRLFSTPEREKHKRFLVMFTTSPGNAMFEATVDYHIDTGMKISDDISRTNKYGNTSVCVPVKPLRRYCYCRKQN